MKLTKYLAAGLLLIVGMGVALAVVAPRQNYTSDTSARIRKRTLEFMEQSSQDIGWRFITDTADDTAQDLSGATTVLWLYRDTNQTWAITVTGSVETATNGQVLVEITPAQLNTNGTFEWILTVTDGTDTMAFAYGDLILDENPVRTSGTLATGTNVNWLNYSNYLYTITDGPYLPGDALSGTANARGQVTLDISVSGEARGNLLQFDGTNWIRVAQGTVGQVLTSGGAGALHTYDDVAGDITGVSGTAPIAGGGTSGDVVMTWDGSGSFDATGATNMSGTEIRSGTVADARIASTIARDTEVVAGDLAGSNYVDLVVADYLPLAGGTMAGNIAMGLNNITGVGLLTMAGNIAMGLNNITDVGLLSAGGPLGQGETRLYDDDGSYMQWTSPGTRQFLTDMAGTINVGTWTIEDLNIVLDGSAIRGSAATNGNEFVTLDQSVASNALDRAYADAADIVETQAVTVAYEAFTVAATNALSTVAHDNDHGSLDGLADNDHPQYYAMAGMTGYVDTVVDGNVDWAYYNLSNIDQLTASNAYRLCTGLYDATEYITYQDTIELVGSFAQQVLWGATNLHPTITANPSMLAANPAKLWISTNVLAAGTNYLGTWYYTNNVTTEVPRGTYTAHFPAIKTQTGGPVVETFYKLVVSDGTTTNVLATSDSVTMELTLKHFDMYAHVLAAQPYGATYFLGVSMYAVRTGGTGASLFIYGGTETYDATLLTPSLSAPAGDAATLNGQAGSYYRDFANTTNRLGRWGAMVPNLTNAVYNFTFSPELPYAATVTSLRQWCQGPAVACDLLKANVTNDLDNYTIVYTNFAGAANAHSNITVDIDFAVGDRFGVMWTNPATGVTNWQFSAGYTY